jgi:translocation and assembly module TamA
MGPGQIKQFTLSLAISALAAMPAAAYDLSFTTPGASSSLRDTITGASLLQQSVGDKSKDAQDIFSAARADYNRIVTTLFSQGYYSGVVSIKLDGREAASISPLDAPKAVRNVVVSVMPGPNFRFSKAKVAPLAPDTKLPEGFAVGQPAKSGLVVEAATAGVDGWLEDGHA